MNDLFKDVLMDDETIFKDETFLDFEYVPEKMPERDNEIRTIADYLKPLFHNRRGSNIFIHGMPGFLDNDQLRITQSLMQSIGVERRTNHIITTVNQDCRDILDFIGIPQDLSRLEKASVSHIMVFYEGERDHDIYVSF